jgi:hypothetical protein
MTETLELSAAERVKVETERFRAALPELFKKYPGKWVVFHEGKLISVHDTPDQAFEAGLKAFGREGGQVIGQVICLPPAPVTAGVLFNVAS